MFTYEKLNLLLINSINFDFSSLEMQRRLIQTKLYYKFPLPCLKRNVTQTLGSSSSKKCSVIMLLVQFASKNDALFHVISEIHYFSRRFIVNQRSFATAMLLRSLKQMLWKVSVFMYVISTITLQYC